MSNYSREKLLLKCSSVFARLHYKINFDISNTSSSLLATDLLKDNSKRRLFKIVATNIEDLFIELLYSDTQLTSSQNRSLLFSIIRNNTQAFLTECYGFQIIINSNIINDSHYTKSLLNDEETLFSVLRQILTSKDSKLFRSIFLPIYAKAYDNFIEALLDNLVVEVTNAVMFIIVNEFSFIYSVRKNFYRSNFLSLRNVERFRNNLGWQSHIKTSVKRPSDIYNSQKGVWIIRTTGLYYRTIYANRTKELSRLRNLSLITLFTIEIKDFVISRIDELTYFLSSSVRYTLTSIIGKIIGLIWRGIIEGLKK